MPAPASLDLRRRVVETYRKGGLTYAEVAARFSVGVASVSRWLRLARKSGEPKPRPHGGGRVRLLGPEHEKALHKLVLAHPDWTEAEYTRELRRQYRMTVSSVTIGRVIRQLGFSRKKRPYSPPRETGRTFSRDGSTTLRESKTSPLRVWFLWTKRAPTLR